MPHVMASQTCPGPAVELWSYMAWCWLIVRTLNLASQAGFYCCLVLWAALGYEMLVQAGSQGKYVCYGAYTMHIYYGAGPADSLFVPSFA